MSIYGPYGHDQRLNQYARYGYPGKELKHTNSTVKTSAQLDIPIKSYACFTILGQIYIVKMAIFDQFYRHRKEWSYRDFKDIFGNGMACRAWENLDFDSGVHKNRPTPWLPGTPGEVAGSRKGDGRHQELRGDVAC